MSETNQNSFLESTADVRIVRLNTDKTRKTKGTDTAYQVYFELSGIPSQAWGNIFEEEWKGLSSISASGGRQEKSPAGIGASIDGRFLVIHCPLQDIATHLPVLKKAVTATNKTYKQYVQEQATEQERRDDIWKEEKIAVDGIAKSLRFE